MFERDCNLEIAVMILLEKQASLSGRLATLE